MALDHAFGAICLRRLGYQDGAFSRLIEQYLDQPQPPGRERLPHRALEQGWLAGLAGRPAPAASRAELCRQSILGCGLDLLQQRRADLYACTHAVMYATNLGAEPLVLPRPAAVLGAELDAAIAVSLDRHDYDLAGELLACCFMIGGELSATARFGFEVLLDVEDQAGFLPAPTLQLDRLAGLHGSDRARYLFAASYHTIYVMGLLCAQALCRGPGYPAAAGPDGPALAVEGLDDSRHWWPRYAASSPERQSGLQPLLVSISLHRAVTAHDLGRVARILAGLPPAFATSLPAAVQASQLLARATAATLG